MRSKGPRGVIENILALTGAAWVLHSGLCLAGPASAASPAPSPIRILSGQAPATLNPRATLDATGQWLSSLLFRGLTHLDPDLTPKPDLASSWTALPGGDVWVFEIPPALDHEGNPITAELLARCLVNYQASSPKSPLSALLPHWKSASVPSPNRLEIRLTHPDPYLPQLLSNFRYFREEGAPEPCREPSSGKKLVTNAKYRIEAWNSRPGTELQLVSTRPEFPDLQFSFIQDDNTRVLKMLRGEVDATLNGISLSKTRWLQEQQADRFNLIHRPGARVSFLAFNLRDPILGKREVREAISLAIDRTAIIESKLGTFGAPAGSILSPLLPESRQSGFEYNPRKAVQLLSSAGFPADSTGIRFHLGYKTTPVRDGLETGLIISEMLRKVGIAVDLQIMEPGVFFASLRRNAFQLYSSRWLSITDGSILFRTLHSGHPSNRSGYSDPEMDRLLDTAVAELDPAKRKELYGRIQDKAAHDLPYLPLWYWYNTLILKKDIQKPAANEISLNGAYDVFSTLRRAPGERH